MSTLTAPDGGEVWVAGHRIDREPDAVRRAIGVTGQFSAVDNLLTAEENLVMMSDLQHLPRRVGRERIATLLDQFELTDARGQLPSTFSGGMRRKLDLAMSLIGDPRVVFLDEPTSGLDPRSRRTMWDIVRALANAGVTILLTTQYLEEADQLADRIGVLDRGQLVAEGTAAQLKSRVNGGHIRLVLNDPQTVDIAVNHLAGATGVVDTATVTVPHDGSMASLRNVLARLDSAQVDVASLTLHTPDLDDVFLALTGRPTTDPTANPDQAPPADRTDRATKEPAA